MNFSHVIYHSGKLFFLIVIDKKNKTVRRGRLLHLGLEKEKMFRGYMSRKISMAVKLMIFPDWI